MIFLRKILSVLCVFALLLSINSFVFFTKAEQSVVRNKKYVSVVYDDSGSMKNEKWEYTNYAMQSFAAMLNDEDILDITYMSSYKDKSFLVDTVNRDASVKKIREHSVSGETPAESIDAAFNTLKKHIDTNENSQYWLIVMTDGDMNGDETAEEKINKYADEIMPNNTKPQIVFMTICDVEKKFTPSFSKSNIKSKEALTADEVVDVISGIACDISGRYAVSKDDINFIDNKTVEIRADVPLTHIGILAQRSDAVVEKIVGANRYGLVADCNVYVEAPGKYADDMEKDDIDALRGNVSLYSAQNGNIPTDTYTVRFTKDISADDLVIMFEPAFELRLEVSVDGVPVDDISVLTAEQIIDIEGSLYELGTDNRILSSMLPNGIVEQIEMSENGNIVISENDLLLEDVELNGNEITVTASLEIPGYFSVTDTISFDPMSVALSDMVASIYYDGSERMLDKDGVVDAENVVYITELENNKTGVKFTLYIDGQPIDATYANSIKSSFAEGLNIDFDNYEITICDDGGIIVSPTKTKLPTFIYWLIHKGDSTIEATYGGKTASDLIIFKIGDTKKVIFDIILFLTYLFIFIYLIYWLFFKPHFRKNGSIKLYIATTQYGEYLQDYGKTKRVHWLSASGPLNFFGPKGMKKRIGNYYVRAAKTGYIIEGVKGKSVSTSMTYPSPSVGIQESKKNAHNFSMNIYVYDGVNYYKISVSR